MEWSKPQLNIFNFVESGTGNAIVEAVAGSGKTTTIVGAIKRVPPDLLTMFLAFNKSIAEELKHRGVNAKTYHSLCCGAAMAEMGADSVYVGKSTFLLRKHFSPNDNHNYGTFAARLVSLGKQVGMGCLVAPTDRNWRDIIDYHELELEKENTTIERAIEITNELLDFCNKSNLIDFDDMLYIPVLRGLRLPKFDFIFVDEAQDTNAIQRAILHKIMKPSSRLIAVGDPAQAIYGFRGANTNSLNLIRKEFDCKVLPLSVSYRCDKAIVEHARQWVSHIQARPGAADGKVYYYGSDWSVRLFDPNDLVICRTTKPLLEVAFRMLRSRIPVTVMGREVGQGLVKLIQSFKTDDIALLQIKVREWADKETEKAVANDTPNRVSSVSDKSGCIIALAEEISNEGGNVQTLINAIEILFTPTQNSTILATIHKAKGLEADTVYWLNSSQCPSKWARQDWQKVQEDNLCYVATTRAKNLLCLIEMGD